MMSLLIYKSQCWTARREEGLQRMRVLKCLPAAVAEVSGWYLSGRSLPDKYQYTARIVIGKTPTSRLGSFVGSLPAVAEVFEMRMSLGALREEPFPRLRSRPINPLPEPPEVVSCDNVFESSPGVVAETEPERNL